MMNAYELADDIVTCTTDPLHKRCADMLLQQADRIAELEEEMLRYRTALAEERARTQKLEKHIVDGIVK